MEANRTERRLRIAGIVLFLGLFVEVLSLFGNGPIAFLVFSGACATLILGGILLTCTKLFRKIIHHRKPTGSV